MRLVIFDTIFPVGHKDLNSKLIDLLSHFTDLTVLNKPGYYTNKYPSNVKICTNKLLLSLNSNIFLNQCYQVWNFLMGFLSVLFVKYDKILFFTFDTVGFAIGRFLFFRKDMYLFHHRNTAELENRYKKKIFLSYANSVNHIVFTDFIKDYLVNELHISPHRVFVLPHPLILPEREDTQINSSDNTNAFVGLGYANDEQLIKRIVEKESKEHLLEKNGIRLILRSKEWNYDSNAIKILKGHLQREEYDRYFYSAKAILVLYPESYKNRMSGAIMDAFNHKKTVIGTKVPIVSYFSENYPTSCKLIASADELFDILIGFRTPEKEQMKKELDLFTERHSDKVVMHKLEEIFDDKNK